MAEKPILFSGEMVRAILDGRKTVTRRVVKPQPIIKNGWAKWGWGNVGGQKAGRPRRCIWHVETWQREAGTAPLEDYCPYGRPGDLLWVRETWAIDQGFDSIKPSDISSYWGGLYYKAAGDKPVGKWRPSIFMPRWASRITLRVCDVRVERLQDINDVEVLAEGIQQNGRMYDSTGITFSEELRGDFRNLWDSINGDRVDKNGDKLPYAWKDNPWVWVVSFEPVR